MSKKNNQMSLRSVFVISVIVLAAVLTLPGCKKQPIPKKAVEQAHTESDYNKPLPATPAVESPNSKSGTLPQAGSTPSTSSGQASSPQAKPEAEITAGPKASPKANLSDIVRAAKTWGPAYSYSFGHEAPDFTLTDISGKQHKLSDYRGKGVLITFWATWCGPCRVEVPHLIALRNSIGEDKLAMLAISYQSKYPPETAEKVKTFVEQNKINYKVFSTDPVAMPLLFSRVSGIPCSFFITPEGKVKLATEGLLSLGEIKAILEAE